MTTDDKPQDMGASGFDPSRGDDLCNRCGVENPVWFASHDVWNYVVGGPNARGDPGGVLCPVCFIGLASAIGLKGSWELRPSRPPIARPHQVRAASRRTIQTCLLEVLYSQPAGIKIGDLTPLVQDAYGAPLARVSISPQLSRLKAAGAVAYADGYWFIEARSDATPKSDAAEGESAAPQEDAHD
jgi:hypothetical protein